MNFAMTEPRFRTLYKRIEDAPQPKADGFWIAVEYDGEVQDFVSRGGKYEAVGRRYLPAVAD